MILKVRVQLNMDFSALQQPLNVQHPMNVYGVGPGVNLRRDPAAQTATGLMSSDGMCPDYMLVDGGALQMTSTVQPSPFDIDWSSLGEGEFDLQVTFVSTSRRPDPQPRLVLADQIHN